jgi:2-polyprenyl-3-methyl-5-hydroxy-6-metoxy-1,4-benzoquinol methylase
VRHATRTGSEGGARAALAERRRSGGPRVALFVFDARDWDAVREVVERLPRPVDAWLDEIVVMADAELVRTAAAAPRTEGLGKADLLVHRSPREHGHGGARKAAFEYAMRRGFDFVVLLRAGIHPPEAVPDLLLPLLDEPDAVAVGSRLLPRTAIRREGTTVGRLFAHRGAAFLLNRVLRMRLLDYQSTLRAIPGRLLRAVPFQLDAEDRDFDIQLLVQCRALGVRIHEVGVAPAWREFPTRRAGLADLLSAIGQALDYRLHQLHLVRRGRYMVETGVHYQLKLSPTSSHMQVVDAIQPGSRVLDLGCSQGLLARPLRRRDVRLTGVDARPPEHLAPELAEYFQRDLEQPLQLPTGRVFDYVICSDVIEHVRRREVLLRSARRYLKEGGRLIISTPNIALWFYRLSLLVGRFEYGPRGVLDETHVHLFTRASFRREVERSGFHILRERVSALPFEVVFESTGRSPLVRGIARSYWLLARLWPQLFAYQFILEAEITTLDEEATASSASVPRASSDPGAPAGRSGRA